MLKNFFAIFLSLTFIILTTINTNAQELEISAPSVILMEQSTGEILYEVNSNEARACASITKVMTLLLTMESIKSGKIKLTDTLYASAHASSMGGSDIWLKEGEAMTVKDLIKATMIMSANDAAVVLAEAVAGSEELFVNMMNERAKELGMNNTTFKNCNGLDEEGHLTTANDVALMSKALLEYKEIYEYSLTWIDYVRDGQTQLVNTNKLLKSYKGITGLKTGTTSQAGSCIVATAERNYMTIIAVVLGANSTDNRFKDASTLLDYGFNMWNVQSPELQFQSEIKVKNGMVDSVELYVDESSKVLTKISENSNISTNVILEDNIEAPILENQVIGKIEIKNGTQILKTISIKSKNSVEKITFSKALLYLISNFKF